MNKQTMHAIRKQGQAGFTLIELIVVIVILGILAATALPKFANLGGDARVASLNAARGALQSAASTAHGQWLVDPTRTQVTQEGTTFLFSVLTTVGTATNVATGYPTATDNITALNGFANAAGLNINDYAVTSNATASIIGASGNTPAIPAHGMVIVPKSVSATASGLTCFISYAEATGGQNGTVITITPPAISAVPIATACQ
ncbi:type II secretion system protein [Rugamonas sp.]|uniref:type II secretion system protein n=1 Tax=Rugamonas sp. TaxID=1926287 RepID=UPI0025CB9084|nr:type II secretion system protein [Rugamonas sp.]